MEKNKSINYEKRKSEATRFSGGGVLGGVALLGGGLAVAGLVAAFSIIKNKNSEKREHKNERPTTAAEKTRDGNEGLNSVHKKLCCTNHGTPTIDVTERPMDSWELVSAYNGALKDNPLPIMDEEKEILFSKEKESIQSCNQNEESSLPASEHMIKDDSAENLQVIQTIELKIEEEPAETEELAAEGNLPMELVKVQQEDDDSGEEHSIENEEENTEEESVQQENSLMEYVEEQEEDDDHVDINYDENDDDINDDRDDSEEDVMQTEEDGHEDISEDVTEKEEESSEGAGSSASSGDSNVEAIWPTEMIEALSRELKVMKANDQISGEKAAKAGTYDSLNCKSNGNIYNEDGSNNETTEHSTLLNKETTRELATAKVETKHLPRWEVCIWSSLVVLSLLLLLHIHRTAAVCDLSHHQNSVIGPQV